GAAPSPLGRRVALGFGRGLAIEPGRVRVPGGRVHAGEFDRANRRIRNGDRPVTGAIEHLHERLGRASVAIEEVAHELGVVVADDRHVAAVVERALDDVSEGDVGPGNPALEALLVGHSRPVTVVTTVSRKPRSDENVWLTAVAS